MTILIYILFLILLLALLAMWPGRGRRSRMEAFARTPVAHRGLHNNDGEAPENSMAAFKKAVEAGFGIELDVRDNADGTLVIAHDDSLLRPAGIDNKISELGTKELSGITLFHSGEHIPLFQDVLNLVAGQVPLIIEIKSETYHVEDLCQSVAFLLDSYEGLYCVESFNPFVLRWFKKNRPQTLRGQLAEKFPPGHLPSPPVSFLFSACMLNFLTKPDFIAYNILHRHLLRYRIQRDLFHAFAVAWTAKSEDMIREAAADFDVFIFDSFIPSPASAPSRPDSGKPEKERVMKDLIRVHMLISGSVTAVGFRYRATRIAQELDITGWVRNTSDDMQVEMEAQGTRLMIDTLMERLRHERYIHITDVEETPVPLQEHEYEFKVRY